MGFPRYPHPDFHARKIILRKTGPADSPGLFFVKIQRPQKPFFVKIQRPRILKGSFNEADTTKRTFICVPSTGARGYASRGALGDGTPPLPTARVTAKAQFLTALTLNQKSLTNTLSQTLSYKHSHTNTLIEEGRHLRGCSGMRSLTMVGIYNLEENETAEPKLRNLYK